MSVIDDTAFCSCRGLTSITIPVGVSAIGDGAFIDCWELNSITVTIGNKKYHSSGNCLIETESKTLILGCKNSIIPSDGSVTAIGKSAFNGCRSLERLSIPKSVSIIGDYAFCDCESLCDITLPDSITSIGKEAFCGCKALESISLPEGVKLGENVFERCPKVKIEKRTAKQGRSPKPTVLISADFNIEDGVLVKYKGCASEVVIPDAVKEICGRAFCGCSSLTSITIGSSVTGIGERAFSFSSNIMSITMGSSVTNIGDYAFSGCSILTSITYRGTKREWKRIKKGKHWNEATGEYIVHCIDGDIKKFWS